MLGGGGGWLASDDKAISVQLNLTGTGTGTDLGFVTKQVMIWF